MFALSPSLHCAADQGQTAEEMAAAKAAQREDGEVKQRYLKIVEILSRTIFRVVYGYGSDSSERRTVDW